jgi:DNA-binding CsgD family transcriptional regulator
MTRLPAREKSTLGTLSPRERQIARLVAAGRSNKEIGWELKISPQTVKNTLTKIFDKTGLHSRIELAVRLVSDHYEARARREGWRFGGRLPVGDGSGPGRSKSKKKRRVR